MLNGINEDLSKIEAEGSQFVNSDDTLATLIANEKSREVLSDHLPTLMNSPRMSQIIGYLLERASITSGEITDKR